MSEKNKLLVCILLVQFVNAVDFILPTPLVPDLVKALSFSSELGAWLAGSYVLAATLSAILIAKHIDRFSRKKLMLVSLLGLLISTIACALSPTFNYLLLARFVAGLFGGPAIAVGMAIIAEKTAEADRAKAMSVVMAGYPIAAIFGIPLALFFADVFVWQYAFYFLCLLIVLSMIAVYKILPCDSVVKRSRKFTFSEFFKNPILLLAAALPLIMNVPVYFLMPHTSTLLQLNFGFPREYLSMLYLATGIINLLIMIKIGKLADQFGIAKTTFVVSVIYCLNIYLWLLMDEPLNAALHHIVFMVSYTALVIPVGALATMVPAPEIRGGFSSMLSLFQHAGCAIGSVMSYYIISSNNTGALNNINYLGGYSILFILLLPICVAFIVVRRRRQLQVTVS